MVLYSIRPEVGHYVTVCVCIPYGLFERKRITQWIFEYLTTPNVCVQLSARLSVCLFDLNQVNEEQLD